MFAHQGQNYNIPISLWLMDSHPYHAPLCFVKPTPDMQIKVCCVIFCSRIKYLSVQVSKHVDHSGKIYLPYLHEWARSALRSTFYSPFSSLNIVQAKFWTSWADPDLHCHIQVLCQSFPISVTFVDSVSSRRCTASPRILRLAQQRALTKPKEHPIIHSRARCEKTTLPSLSVHKYRDGNAERLRLKVWCQCSDSNAIRGSRLHPSVHRAHPGLPRPVHTGIDCRNTKPETQDSPFSSHQASSTFPSAYPVAYQQTKGCNNSFFPTGALYVIMRTKLFTQAKAKSHWISSAARQTVLFRINQWENTVFGQCWVWMQLTNCWSVSTSLNDSLSKRNVNLFPRKTVSLICIFFSEISSIGQEASRQPASLAAQVDEKVFKPI